MVSSYVLKIVVLNAIWQTITVGSTWAVLKATMKVPFTPYHCISPFIVALTLQMQTTRDGAPYPRFFTPILRYWFDFPLVSATFRDINKRVKFDEYSDGFVTDIHDP